MKNFIQWIALVLVSGTLLQCTDQTESFEPVKIQFTFQISELNGGRVADATEQPSQLLLSIESFDGVPVYSLEEVELIKFGNGYITQPLDLQKGSYRITDFLLVSENSEVLYATPKKGSSMEEAVSTPIPRSFFVAKNSLETIEMEVIDVSHVEAEDLGYLTFGINVVNPIRLSVFALEEEGYSHIPSNVYIMDGADTIAEQSLDSKLGLVSFAGDPDTPHRLLVTSEGYNFKTLDFVYSDLIESLQGSPLEFTLDPAFTMSAYVPRDNYGTGENLVVLEMYGTKDLYVDWGDGTMTYGIFEHAYRTPANYDITVTGDLHSIQYFTAFYDIVRYYRFDFRSLTGLVDINIGLISGPNTIDISNCINLRSVTLTGITQMAVLVLPEDNFIKHIDFTGPNKLSAFQVNRLIDNIHRNAVTNNERDGSLFLHTTWYPPYDELIGPPSATSIAKMEELRDVYNWTIQSE